MQERGNRLCYFLGGNTTQGFVSLYGAWCAEETAQALYVLKGGAGCGKSTLMKTLGKRWEAQGEAVEWVHCSGDPDSLDAVRVPRLGVSIVDGTAPQSRAPDAQSQNRQRMVIQGAGNFAMRTPKSKRGKMGARFSQVWSVKS